MELRPYQQAAIDAVYRHLRDHDNNPCVVIPTAGGKTPVLSTICRDAVQLWDGRVLILAHVKELLEQAVDKLRAIAPDLPFGVYSAGLNRRDTDRPVIVAGIQSIYKRACELDAFDLVIVDECHMVPEEGDGMYRQFLVDAKKVNPNLRVIGLTATPYRMKSGMICGPDNILNAVCYEVGIRELIQDGFLCPLVTKAGRQKADTSGLHVRGGEFVAGELEDLMDQDALVEAASAEIVEQTRDRQACLIFASGVRHGEHVVRVLAEKHGIECGFVCGETSDGQRAELLARFRGLPSDGLFERTPL
ncbi:MAG: DEAD/DEAH box helicase family protein, partial [Pirellulales bacterium]